MGWGQTFRNFEQRIVAIEKAVFGSSNEGDPQAQKTSHETQTASQDTAQHTTQDDTGSH
jgi:hypothetical protein